MVGRVLVFVYAVVAYLAFLASMLYLIAFVGDLWVPRSVDTGPEAPLLEAAAINVLLVALFAIQHTVMARPAFKSWWTRLVPRAAERSTFVLAASALVGLICWQWRPIPGALWEVNTPVAQALLWGLFFVGWGVLFYASFLIDHFDLFGLRQGYLYLIGKPYTHPPLKTVSLYKWVRHPLMLGILVGVWSIPTMTYGHLLFAGLITAYVLVGIQFEERDLRRHLGAGYEQYRRETPMLIPVRWRRAHGITAGEEQTSPSARQPVAR
jgi:protein-S-isoprenylcysteine O-methyltransferase Ste14